MRVRKENEKKQDAEEDAGFYERRVLGLLRRLEATGG